ncbi:MAG: hypothetical protein RIT81_27250 [Deltaproteobacteria bacterium]
MADSGRWGRMLSRWGVRVMDGVVSAVARRPVRTGATDVVVTSPGTLAARAGAMKSAGPSADAMKSAGPSADATNSAARPTDATNSAARPRDATNSAALPPDAKKSAPSEAPRKLVTVARDPDTAFVYWACPDDEGEARLVWRAGARTVRVERVDAAAGKRYLPFVTPDEPHAATLELDGHELTSNAARPPEAAPRAAGPAVFIHPADPERRALAERQRRQREQLVRPTHPRPEHVSSSRRG